MIATHIDTTMLAGLLLATVDWAKLGTGLVIGLSVCLFALSLFGQRGRMEITPEREMALAAGHADRKTVFENTILQPIMWLLLVLGRYLRLTSLKRWLREKLIAAGSPNFFTADEYVAVAMLWAIACPLGFQLINFVLRLGFPIAFVLPIGAIGGFCGALYHIHGKAAKRVKEISRRVPYTLDLVSLAMGAGATFTEAVQTLVHEDPEHPFNVELNTVLAEIGLGTARQQAMQNLADRVPLDSLRSIMAAVIQAERLGTPLSEVLTEQANLMRLDRTVQAEKLAAQASVRILLPSMLILISVVFTIFAPLIILAIRGKLL